MVTRDDNNKNKNKNKYSIFKDPDLWIANSGATVHMTPYDQGFKNIRGTKEDGGVTMANGEVKPMLKIGDILGTVVNKEGVSVMTAIIIEVSHLPNGKFNLFSTTTMQQKGWLLGGNANITWLEKGNITLVFNIKIQTKKGTLFAMRHVRENQQYNWIEKVEDMRIAATGTDGNKENKLTRNKKGDSESPYNEKFGNEIGSESEETGSPDKRRPFKGEISKIKI